MRSTPGSCMPDFADEPPHPTVSWRGYLLPWLAIAASVIACGTSAGIGRDTTTWERFGAVQVLAGPEQLCVFVQVDRMVHLPGWAVELPTRLEDSRVVVLNVGAGDEARHVVAEDGPSLDADRSRVFRHEGRTYLLGDARSAQVRWLVWSWDGSAFAAPPDDEVLSELQAELGDLPREQAHAAIDALTAGAGWRVVLAESAPLRWNEGQRRHDALPEDPLQWGERTFEWQQRASQGVISVQLAERGGSSALVPVFVYDARVVPVSD